MYLFLAVAPFVSYSGKCKRRQEETAPTSPGSSHVWSLATGNGFLYEAGSCAERNISNADSLQRGAEGSVSNVAVLWQGTARFHTGSV